MPILKSVALELFWKFRPKKKRAFAECPPLVKKNYYAFAAEAPLAML